MAVEVQRRFRDENRDVPEDQQLLFRIGIHMAEVIDDGGEITTSTSNEKLATAGW